MSLLRYYNRDVKAAAAAAAEPLVKVEYETDEEEEDDGEPEERPSKKQRKITHPHAERDSWAPIVDFRSFHPPAPSRHAIELYTEMAPMQDCWYESIHGAVVSYRNRQSGDLDAFREIPEQSLDGKSKWMTPTFGGRAVPFQVRWNRLTKEEREWIILAFRINVQQDRIKRGSMLPRVTDVDRREGESNDDHADRVWFRLNEKVRAAKPYGGQCMGGEKKGRTIAKAKPKRMTASEIAKRSGGDVDE